jgi:hypothetical protein
MESQPDSFNLIRVSGHSGAGKTRLFQALPSNGIHFPRVIPYTSRPARTGEVHGKDYYFLSRSAIEALPSAAFAKAKVREMYQAVDLVQVWADLRLYRTVFAEVHPDLWPAVLAGIHSGENENIRIYSVFFTAVDPASIKGMNETSARGFLAGAVLEILEARGFDDPVANRLRSEAAANEILHAIRSEDNYDRIFYSAPEGPDGEDDWTRAERPVGRAGEVLSEFLQFLGQVGEG